MATASARCSAASTRCSTGRCARSSCPSSWSTFACSASAQSTCRAAARCCWPPTTAASSIRSSSARSCAGPSTTWPSASCSRIASWRGCSTASAPSPSTAAPATRTRWRPRARSCSAETASCCSPRARACAQGRSARRAAASRAWRCRPAPRSRRSRSIGTEDVRRGWRIRPRRVRLRVGAPMLFAQRRRGLARPRGGRHRAHLGQRHAAVGVAGRRRCAPSGRHATEHAPSAPQARPSTFLSP